MSNALKPNIVSNSTPTQWMCITIHIVYAFPTCSRVSYLVTESRNKSSGMDVYSCSYCVFVSQLLINESHI